MFDKFEKTNYTKPTFFYNLFNYFKNPNYYV